MNPESNPTEADMPGLWDRVAERMADPSPDFYLAGGPWDMAVDIRTDGAAFTLHFPADWHPDNIVDTVQKVVNGADETSKKGRLSRTEALRGALCYLVSVSGYVALAVGPVKGSG